MKIKEINVLKNTIEIKEEKKGLFRIREYTTEISIELIDKIERIIENGKLIGIILWHDEEAIHGAGIKNYDKDLDALYNKIISIIKDNSIEVLETRL